MLWFSSSDAQPVGSMVSYFRDSPEAGRAGGQLHMCVSSSPQLLGITSTASDFTILLSVVLLRETAQGSSLTPYAGRASPTPGGHSS